MANHGYRCPSISRIMVISPLQQANSTTTEWMIPRRGASHQIKPNGFHAKKAIGRISSVTTAASPMHLACNTLTRSLRSLRASSGWTRPTQAESHGGWALVSTALIDHLECLAGGGVRRCTQETLSRRSTRLPPLAHRTCLETGLKETTTIPHTAAQIALCRCRVRLSTVVGTTLPRLTPTTCLARQSISWRNSACKTGQSRCSMRIMATNSAS
mmetsp:Transcript_38905/g.64588  ORF Transcript_38905/g.64588 Transcript_38905/m.64588 type:complete len:214 (+) Transcript_38905:219-860(+)